MRKRSILFKQNSTICDVAPVFHDEKGDVKQNLSFQILQKGVVRRRVYSYRNVEAMYGRTEKELANSHNYPPHVWLERQQHLERLQRILRRVLEEYKPC